MIHKLGYDAQCEICGKACMFDDVNDEGKCAECRDNYPVLSKLSAGRVFSIKRHEDGDIEFLDGCDESFGVVLSEHEILALAEELKTYAAQHHGESR